MASSAEGDALTQRFVIQQQAIRAATLRDLTRLWPLLDKSNIDASTRSYFIAVKALVKNNRRISAAAAAEYYRAFRAAEGVTSGYSALMFDQIRDDVLETALRVTGPVSFKRAIGAGKAVSAASDTALVTQSGAVSRLVVNAGRDTVGLNMERDTAAVGWQRVTSGKACYFCAMLASRGAHYRSEKSALYRGNGGAKYHDHCMCSAEPIYDKSTPLRGQNAAYSELWKEATEGKSGREAVNAFRKALG